MVASEAQHAEQVIEGLKANITVLEARLRETEDAKPIEKTLPVIFKKWKKVLASRSAIYKAW